MKPPTRPAGVPDEAVWVEKDNEWQLGVFDKRGVIKSVKVPVGEWRYWRSDGTLVCLANFDAEGRPHGILERYHPDGSLASRGEWKNGNRNGRFVYFNSEIESEEHFPAASRVWRYEFDSTANWHEENRHWFLKDGTECTSDGRPLSDAFDLDHIFDAAEPVTFLKDHAIEIRSLLEDQEEVSNQEDPLQLEELWGVTYKDIDAFVNRAASGGSGFRPATSRRTFEENVWFKMIAHPWDNCCEELGIAFMGAVKIGYFGDSDHVYSTIFQSYREEPKPNGIFLWSHDTHYVDEVLSLSIDEFAYRVALAASYEQERISVKAARAAWKKLSGKCYVGWCASDGLEDAINYEGVESSTDETQDDADDEISKCDFECNLDPENSITGPFWRAQWIVELLNEDRRRNWSDIKETFRPGWNRALTQERYDSLKQSGNTRLPHTALYLLWRLFWFKQTDRLKECCDLYRNHKARIVRDLVQFLEEIESGRKEIGDIKDIHAVRDEFLRLDLIPEREEQRSQERTGHEGAEAVRLQAVSTEVEELAKEGLEKLIEKAWQNVTDCGALEKYERAARKVPGNELLWRCLDFVRNYEFRRDDFDATDEAIGVGIWLGQNGCEVLQPFIWGSLYSESYLRTANLLIAIGRTQGALDNRLEECCLKQLEIAEEYHFKRALAVKLLEQMQSQKAIPKLCQIIDEYFTQLADKRDFEARLATIPWIDCLTAIAEALGKLVGTDRKEHEQQAINALKKLLKYSIQNYEEKSAVAALNSLVEWGATDLLSEIASMLSNDTPSQIAALQAIESIAPKLHPAQRNSFVNIYFRNPSDDNNSVTLMYYRAALALQKADPNFGNVEPIDRAIAEARQLYTYGDALWNQFRILECDTVGKFPQLDVTTIEHYLQSSNVSVREAAEAAFMARGLPLDKKRPIEWPIIWKTLADEGIDINMKVPDTCGSNEALEDVAVKIANLMLADNAISFGPPAAWLWQHRTASAADVLAKVIDKKLNALPKIESGEYLPSEYTWLMRALAKHASFPSCIPLVTRCLSHANQEIGGGLLQDLDCMPMMFAGELLKMAKEREGWQRFCIAKWMLENKEVAEIAVAIKEAGLTAKKLKTWMS
ncbi:MAG: hypothetical protein K2Y39_12595 [Candidatus Obscuribacterales bacterium]|nr:hypothetical protein [Candidatus Obscuribacterales bacterium]